MSVITCRTLGGIGRAGNQFFLYCFCKAYAKRHGCELQTGDWLGRHILANANEPFVSDPTLPQTEIDSHTKKPLDRYFGRTGIDIRVYAQHELYTSWYSRKEIREWLTLKPEFEALAPKIKPVTVAHLRRGDYCDNESFSKFYCAVSEKSYDAAVEKFYIPQPVLKVFEGWRKPPAQLPAHLNWLPDFLLMRDAQYLLRANSTFSMFAGWLGHGKVYAPIVSDKVGLQECEFTEGNWPCTAGKFRNQSDLVLREE